MALHLIAAFVGGFAAGAVSFPSRFRAPRLAAALALALLSTAALAPRGNGGSGSGDGGNGALWAALPAALLLCAGAALARRLRVAGLTGGIASGKSRVSAALIALSAEAASAGASSSPPLVLIDLDVLAREVVRPGARAFERIAARFGRAAVVDAATGELDRAALRALIAGDARARAFVNGATHPEIFRLLLRRVAAERWLRGRAVVVDAPLLFESGWLLRALCAPVVVVRCGEERQLRRLLARADGRAGGEPQARALLAAQWPLAQKAALADLVFENDADEPEERTRERVREELLPLLLGL